MQQSILLVDQQKNTADLMKLYLRACGYSIDHTASPSEALVFADHVRYRMVITDLVMSGGITGFDLYRRIKCLDEEIKFMFLLSPDVCYNALKLLGSLERNDVIKKEPLSINEVISKVRTALQSYECDSIN